MMNRVAALETPKTETPSTRLTVWDHSFRALALLSLLLFAALAWDLLAHPDAPTFSTPPSPLWYHALFGFVILPLWWLTSALILWRAPGNLVGRFLLLMLIGALGWQFTFGIGTPEFSSVAFELFLFYWGAIGLPSLVYLLMVFPDGRLFPTRWRKWVFLFAAAKVIGTILELMSIQPGLLTGLPPVAFNPFFVPAFAPYQPLLSSTIGAAGSFIVIGVVMSIASLGLRYRASSTQVRQQIKWLLWWAVVFVLLMPVYYAALFGIQIGGAQLSVLIPLLMYFNLGGLLIAAIGIAILRYRLFYIDLLLNRTLVYGALTAFVIIAYGLIVGYLSTVFRSDNFLFSLIATGIVAVLFQPLREWLQRGVNRLLYGERYDPYAILSKLGQRLEATLALDAVLPTIVETIAQTLKLPYVAISLKDQGGGMIDEENIVAFHGRLPETRYLSPVTFSLTYQHEHLGELIVAPRTGEGKFSEADMRLLETLADQASIAAHAVRLTADLQHSRERLVTAREEERRRIRRDLHDGLGATLAALSLQVGGLHPMLEHEPAEAHALIDEVRAEIRAAVADIRRLVYDLRPPTLDELGLTASIQAQAARCSVDGLQVTVEAPEHLPPLPAAVEAAVYRIVQEALANVTHHAQAKHCAIALKLDGDRELQVVISDDGLGLPADHRVGVGLISMRERAAELGGACIIERAPAGGTHVAAQLPLASSTGEGRSETSQL